MNQNLTFADQAPVFLAFAAIAAEHPELPRVYVTTPQTDDLDIQADDAGDFEAWRAALSLPPLDVIVKSFHGSRWLQSKGTWRGLSVHLTVHKVDIPEGEPGDDAPVSLPVEWSAAVSA